MPTEPRRCRLYLITPPEIADIAAFSKLLDEALDAGDVASLQIRLKSRDGVPAPDHHILELGRHIIPRAQERGVAVLINDRPDLAVELGADGVHIGQTDMPYAKARKLVGPDAIIGVTCHDSRHLALEAGDAGADYVAFGAFFPTDTKDASARAEGWLRRKAGGAGPISGSQSMRNPPVMTERVRAQTRPI